jgi:hypothetical protein
MATQPKDDGFETVSEESPTTIKFDTFGDQFIGAYVGVNEVEMPDGKKFNQYLFRGVGPASAGIESGALYAVNESYKIRQGMAKVTPGQVARITYVKDVPTNQPQPMKDYTIEVKR